MCAQAWMSADQASPLTQPILSSFSKDEGPELRDGDQWGAPSPVLWERGKSHLCTVSVRASSHMHCLFYLREGGELPAVAPWESHSE